MGAQSLRSKLRKEDGLIVGRKKIKRDMEEMGIYAVYPKPNLSKHGKDFKPFPYLLKNKKIFIPNQVWAVDITYIKMGRKHIVHDSDYRLAQPIYRWVDNVLIERWFRSLKCECIYINEFESPRALCRGITAYVEDYNEYFAAVEPPFRQRLSHRNAAN